VTAAERQLLDAVLANPRDDAPRLVYADWLTERGDPRGEFIAMQIKDPYGDTDPTKEQKKKWGGKLASMEDWILGWSFRRGFVKDIHVSQWGWLDRADEVFAEHPVEELSITADGTAAGYAALARSRWLPKIRKLCFLGFGGVRGRMIAPLVKARGLAVDEISVSTNLDLPAAQVLARWPGLVELDVHSSDPMPLKIAWTIARGASLATVERLTLEKMRTAADAAAIVTTLVKNKKANDRLRHLHLARNQLAGPSLRAIFERFTALEYVTLVDTGMTDVKVKALAACPGLASVRTLNIRANGFGDVGARALAESPYLDEIRYLSAGWNRITDEGKKILRKRFGKRVDV
jgi:uncharacterized protein (TIGR02996 family)